MRRSIKTPQLLELSGIGNRAILEKHGIKVQLDLPAVGENMQEHSFVATSFRASLSLPSLSPSLCWGCRD